MDHPARGLTRFLLGSVGPLDSGHALPEGLHQVDHLRSFGGRGSHKLLARHFGFDQLFELAGVQVWVLLQVNSSGVTSV